LVAVSMKQYLPALESPQKRLEPCLLVGASGGL